MYLLEKSIALNGGLVHVRISSNGIDFSDANFIFKYDPVSVINTLTPIWITTLAPVQVTIAGSNFYDT